jgi:hypothetical protein
LLFAPFQLFNVAAAALQGGWAGVKASLSDTSWGQAILGAINSIMGAIDRFKAGWASLQSAAGAGLSGMGAKLSGAWGSVKSAVGMGDSSPATGGGRAVGGLIRAGVPYRINERVPEIMMQGGNTWLLNDQMARIQPLTQLDAANNSSFADVSGRIAESQAAIRSRIMGNGNDAVQSGGIRSLISTTNNNRERLMQQQNNGKRIQIGHVSIHIHGEADAEKILHELEMAA